MFYLKVYSHLPHPMNPTNYLRPKQVCDYLSVSHTTVYKLMKEGKLKSSKVNGSRLIALDDLNAMIQAHTVPASFCQEVASHRQEALA